MRGIKYRNRLIVCINLKYKVQYAILRVLLNKIWDFFLLMNSNNIQYFESKS